MLLLTHFTAGSLASRLVTVILNSMPTFSHQPTPFLLPLFLPIPQPSWKKNSQSYSVKYHLSTSYSSPTILFKSSQEWGQQSLDPSQRVVTTFPCYITRGSPPHFSEPINKSSDKDPPQREKKDSYKHSVLHFLYSPRVRKNSFLLNGCQLPLWMNKWNKRRIQLLLK